MNYWWKENGEYLVPNVWSHALYCFLVWRDKVNFQYLTVSTPEGKFPKGPYFEFSFVCAHTMFVFRKKKDGECNWKIWSLIIKKEKNKEKSPKTPKDIKLLGGQGMKSRAQYVFFFSVGCACGNWFCLWKEQFF